MNITDLKTEFGAYYQDAGQNMARIKSMLTQGIVTPQIATPVKTDDTIYQMSELSTVSLVQAFQKSWTPNNSESFTPKKIELYHMKVDVDIYPDDIEATWLGFLASAAVSRKDWPLVKFLMEEENQGIIARINNDMEMKEYLNGVYAAPQSGVAGTTGHSMNGLVYLLQAGVDAETMNSVNLGSLTTSNIFDKVELFVDAISQVYQNVKMDICMSPEWVKAYLRDKRVQGFYQIGSDKSINLGIDFTPHEVKALPGLTGQDVIFATPKSNLLHITKKMANKTTFKVEEAKRCVNIMADWWEGLGFGMDAAVWTNLQKTVVPPVGG